MYTVRQRNEELHGRTDRRTTPLFGLCTNIERCALAQRLQSGSGTDCRPRRRPRHASAIPAPSAAPGAVTQGTERTGPDLGLLRAAAAMIQPSGPSDTSVVV